MANMDSDSTPDKPLYKINIQHTVSPLELESFCKLLEEQGNYEIVTDLGSGRLEVH